MAQRMIDGAGFAANSYGFRITFPCAYLEAKCIPQSMGILTQGTRSPIGDNAVEHVKISWREFGRCSSTSGSIVTWETGGYWSILSGSTHWFPDEGVNALTCPVVTFHQVLKFDYGSQSFTEDLDVAITAWISSYRGVPYERVNIHETHNRSNTAEPFVVDHDMILVPRGYYCAIVYAADYDNPFEVLQYASLWGVGYGTLYSGADYLPPQAVPGAKRLAMSSYLRNPEWSYTELPLGDLYQEAIQSMKYVEINSVAYLSELGSLLPELKSAVSLASNPSDVRRWAKLYLAAKYGTRLTISDTEQLMKIPQLRSAAKQWTKAYRAVRAMRSVGVKLKNPVQASATATVHVKLYYEPYDHWIAQLVTWLNRYDLLLSFKNVWDLIPFSFVVDWFVDISSMLASIDAKVMTEYINILGTCSSVKFVATCPPNFCGASATGSNFKLTYYSRCVGSSIPLSDLPQPKLEWGPGLSGHEAEASALVTQKLNF